MFVASTSQTTNFGSTEALGLPGLVQCRVKGTRNATETLCVVEGHRLEGLVQFPDRSQAAFIFFGRGRQK